MAVFITVEYNDVTVTHAYSYDLRSEAVLQNW